MPLADRGGEDLRFAALRPGVVFLSDDAHQRLSAPGHSSEGEALPPALADARIAVQSGVRSLVWRRAGGCRARAAYWVSWTSVPRSRPSDASAC